jgi:hypothetical protein
MKHPLFDRLATVTAIILFLLAYVPLLLLSAHNHPSAADDYCFADTAVRYGFWQAQHYYYNGWTGRYFSNMLVHGNPLVWGWYDGFRVIPALIVTGLLAATYALINELLRDQSVRIRLLTTALTFYTIITALQSTVEAFFWTAAVASYTIPTVLTLYLLVVLLRWYRLPPGLLKTLTTVWAGVLVFAIVGSGETNLVLLTLILLAIGAYRLFFRRTVDGLIAYLLVVALASSALVFLAPGNAIRLGSNEIAGNLVATFTATVRFMATALLTWLWQTPVIPLSVFWLPIAVRLNKADSSVRTLFQLPPLLLSVLYIGLLFVLMFPSVYGLGVAPGRVMNLVYIVFLLGWFYVLTVWVGWLIRRGGPLGNWLTVGSGLDKPRTGGWATALVSIWLIGTAWLSPTVHQLYGDLLSGRAATYDREMTERRQQLMQPADTLRLTPISVYPASLNIDDIHTDQNHWWNRCQAGYYGHKAVVLTNEPTTVNR